MKFLVVTEGRNPLPPEMAMAMMDMMDGWLAKHRGSGKLEAVWGFAGRPGGGGVLNVDSHEELDEIMAGFPFGQTSSITIYPLADIDAGLANARKVFAQMMGGAG